MHLPSHFVIPLLLTIPTLAQNTTSSPPVLTPAFSGNITIAKPLPPIPIPGGIRLIEPITGGILSGPLLNATITGGVAYPSVVQNGTVQIPLITIYGTTADNASFLVQDAGVGVPQEQFTRITVEVGGKGAGLADEFLLASLRVNAERTVVALEGFVVGS